ncbi:MAG: HGGxSTG domain-containing protein, partial [Hyphomicrobium sp.]
MRLYTITCNARTRAGHPCKRKALANGRCPNHGGLSTGPKTEAGRARCAAATRQRWARWR